MQFQTTNSTNPDPQLGVKALLEAGKRLAAALPLYHTSKYLHPMARTASLGVIRAQVRLCIAALSGVGESQLTALRSRLSQAVRSIQRAPNDATARALYNAPQVQEALWAWATSEASLFIKNLTRNAPVDEDKQTDMVGDAVMGFMREEAKRAGTTKLNPFIMARTWEPERMPDPLGTFRSYLMAWCKNAVQKHYQTQINEGVSLDSPIGGATDGNVQSIGDRIEDKKTIGPEAALMNQNDHRSQVATLSSIFKRQVASLMNDINGFDGKTDAYSVGQRTTLQNRLSAIQDMVGPLLEKLRQTSNTMTATETAPNLAPNEREHELATLRGDFEDAMKKLTAISDAQERAHGKRVTREEASIQSLVHKQQATGQEQSSPVERGGVRPQAYNSKKMIADPITTGRAYSRARENSEHLLPHAYRVLTQRKNTDLSQKYTAGLLTNWRLLDGITSQNDLENALSSDPIVRASANDRALFSTTALRAMMILRDQYTHDEKYQVLRSDEGKIPKSAKQRFIALIGQEIELDPTLKSRAPQILDLLKEFVTGWQFRSLWDSVDHISRTAAYEWARNEKINRRWSDLTPEEIKSVADEAGNLIYNNEYRPFAARTLSDGQNRVTHDLNLSPSERQEVMRQEVGRISGMLRGDQARGAWAHGEPEDSPRFHDKLRATKTVPVDGTPSTDITTVLSSTDVIQGRRFAKSF